MSLEKKPSIVFSPAEVLHDYKNPSIFTEERTPGLNPSNKKSQIRIFWKSQKILTNQFFLKKFQQIGPNFLVQLAGQIKKSQQYIII